MIVALVLATAALVAANTISHGFWGGNSGWDDTGSCYPTFHSGAGVFSCVGYLAVILIGDLCCAVLARTTTPLFKSIGHLRHQLTASCSLALASVLPLLVLSVEA